MFKSLPVLIVVFLFISKLYSQHADVSNFDKKYINWYNKDILQDKVLGASIDKLYDSILPHLEPQKQVVVAVIDCGVDINHPDLANSLWYNEDEIPANGIDDDDNGYVDDYYGWNFLGSPNGDCIDYETFEYTRMVASQDSSHPLFEEATKLYSNALKKYETRKLNYENYERNINEAKSYIHEQTGIWISCRDDLRKVYSPYQSVHHAKKYLAKKYRKGFSEALLASRIETTNRYLNYHLNTEFCPRAIVGDDPSNLNDRAYGNNNVDGLEFNHGTAVAGIISAGRNNGVGVDGVCETARIMPIRAVPYGDERDKDIALAIRYAVDNGADIINLSFGKQVSPNREWVEDAIRYADRHNVLLVHGAGNKGENVDKKPVVPTDLRADTVYVSNFLNVGSNTIKESKKMLSVFSNYGKHTVDLFAPGSQIPVLDTCGLYTISSGTSFSAPVVSGICALMLTYYPDLTPAEIIQILKESVYTPEKVKPVLVPSIKSNKGEKALPTELSVSGGVVNAFNAFTLLEQRK